MQIYQFDYKIFLRNIYRLFILYLHNFKIVMPKLYFIMVHEINTDERVKDVKMLKRVNKKYNLESNILKQKITGMIFVLIISRSIFYGLIFR